MPPWSQDPVTLDATKQKNRPTQDNEEDNISGETNDDDNEYVCVLFTNDSPLNATGSIVKCFAGIPTTDQRAQAIEFYLFLKLNDNFMTLNGGGSFYHPAHCTRHKYYAGYSVGALDSSSPIDNKFLTLIGKVIIRWVLQKCNFSPPTFEIPNYPMLH